MAKSRDEWKQELIANGTDEITVNAEELRWKEYQGRLVGNTGKTVGTAVKPPKLNPDGSLASDNNDE